MRLATLEDFFTRCLPPSGRTSKYADIALYYYRKYAVPTMRFYPHHRGDFAACWMHYYDKPLKRADTIARGGTASSGAHLEATDLMRAEDMRVTLEETLRTVRGASAQERRGREEHIAQVEGGITAFLKRVDVDEAAWTHDVDDLDHGARTPLVAIAAQMRSVAELFCAGFVGAPTPPPDAILSKLAQSLLIDSLIALGQPPVVVGMCCQGHLQPLLARAARLFGLPFWRPPAS